MYPEGTFDFTTMATATMLEATHIIVGEVTDVSFVFEQGVSGPLSLVTVRVDKDIKAEIQRVDNQETRPQERQSSEEERERPPRTVSFVQVGGPTSDGDIVEAVGIRLLKQGDYVFLRLVPSGYPVTHNGKTVNSCTVEYGTMYSVEEEGDELDQHIIKKGWQDLDVNVMEMTRIVRTTLKRPEEMRTLEREMSGLRRSMAKEARI